MPRQVGPAPAHTLATRTATGVSLRLVLAVTALSGWCWTPTGRRRRRQHAPRPTHGLPALLPWISQLIGPQQQWQLPCLQPHRPPPLRHRLKSTCAPSCGAVSLLATEPQRQQRLAAAHSQRHPEPASKLVAGASPLNAQCSKCQCPSRRQAQHSMARLNGVNGGGRTQRRPPVARAPQCFDRHSTRRWLGVDHRPGTVCRTILCPAPCPMAMMVARGHPRWRLLVRCQPTCTNRGV